ncbi:hypothetical protein [Streptomyces sp. MN13]
MPSDTLRALEGGASDLLRFDAGPVHALDAAGPEAQRAVALLAARRASEVAGPAGLTWVAPALTALAEGRPLPAPFDDWDRMWPARSVRGMAVTHGAHTSPAAPAGRSERRISQPHMALPAVFRAGGPEPLRAAVDAVTAAVHAYGEDYPTLLREVRPALPAG